MTIGTRATKQNEREIKPRRIEIAQNASENKPSVSESKPSASEIGRSENVTSLSASRRLRAGRRPIYLATQPPATNLTRRKRIPMRTRSGLRSRGLGLDKGRASGRAGDSRGAIGPGSVALAF
jgi:hypothetical protein